MFTNPLLNFVVGGIYQLVIYVLLIMLLSGLVIVQIGKVFKKFNESDFVKQLITLVVAILLSWIGEFFKVYSFNGLGIVGGIFFGLIFAFISNGIYNIPVVKFIFEKLGVKIPTIKSVV